MFTKFNRVLLASGLALSTAITLAPEAFADTNGSGVLVTTSIDPVQTLTFTADGKVSTTKISTETAAQTIPVGKVTTTSNLTWKITALSANDSKLKNTVGSTDVTIDYQLSIVDGTGDVTLSSSTAGDVYNSGESIIGITDKVVNLKIAESAAVGKKGGTYTDTITLTILPTE